MSATSQDPLLGFQEILEIRRVNNNPLRGHATRRDAGLPGLITCTMPFALVDGRPFVAIGCSEGIWVTDAQDPDFMHRVLDVKGVTGFAVIEEYHLLLVLADKVLYCYALDALDPHGSNKDHIPQKLTGSTSVDFFRVGIWYNSLVLILKRRRVIDSVFRVIEPVFEPPPRNTPNVVVADLGNGRFCYFHDRQEFYVPVDCTDLLFLRSTLAILHPHGFEILDLETLTTVTVPHVDGRTSKALAKRCKSSKPLGLFRGKGGKNLLCYNTFGLFIDRHGNPLYDVDHIIDWHGTVYAVAPVAPYVVLFKARTIEVRHGDTGRLEQVIFGNGMRCSWRGPGVLQGELDEDDLVPESVNKRSRMQVVMNSPHDRGSDETAQHVYDLVLKVTPSR